MVKTRTRPQKDSVKQKESKAESEKRKHSDMKRANESHKFTAKRSENQPLIDALVRLSAAVGEAASIEEKHRYKAAALEKAAYALSQLDEVITQGKPLASGPKKVPGVGKGTAYYIDEFIETGDIAEVETYKNVSKDGQKVAKPAVYTAGDQKAEKKGGVNTVEINRAPVLTLWVVVVAKRQGYNAAEAHTYGKWIASIFAIAKGKKLGIIEETDQDTPKRQKQSNEYVQVFQHVKIPVVNENGNRLALSQGSALDPWSVESYLKRAFGNNLGAVERAMEDLAKSMTPDELRQSAYGLYEKFRPAWKGWGLKSTLDLDKIRSLATK